MSQYLVKGRGWRYDFWFRGQRHQSQDPKFYATKPKAAAAEAVERKRLEDIRDGVKLDTAHSPLIQDWAEEYVNEAIKRGDITEDSTVLFDIKVVLRFFGARPADKSQVERGAPYHNLTLAEIVKDDNWIIQFEEWIDARRARPSGRPISGSTKNKYRTAMSKMFQMAMEPAYRRKTGIVRNPFAEVRRDPGVKRYTTFDGDANLYAVYDAAAPHVRLAMDIALYALKFRRGSILDLEWSKGRNSRAWIDDKMEYLIADQHKTRHHTGMRQTAVIAPELKQILIAAKKKQEATNKRLSKRYGETYSTCNHVVQWEGKPVKDIKRAFKAACERAGVRYGLFGGVTFHSLKHEQGTEAARQGVPDAMAQAIGGWKTASARSVYKHLVPENEREAVNMMAKVTRRKMARGRKALGRDSGRDFPRQRTKNDRNKLRFAANG